MILKRLRITLLAGTMLCGLAAPAQAMPPLGMAIAGAIAAINIGQVVVGLVASLALSAVSAALAPRQQPKEQAQTRRSSGSELTIQYGGAVPRQAALGLVATEGQVVYWNTYGANDEQENIYLQTVHVLGDGEHDGISRIWINGTECTLVPEAEVQAIKGYEVLEIGNRSRIWIRFFSGAWDQVADTELVTHATPPGRWTSNHRGRGVCYISVTQLYDEGRGLTGVPNIRVELRGKKLYDLRKDSTVPGGSGSHRWGQPATYEWSANPSIIEYNYRRGIYAGSQRVLGMSVPASDLINDMYIAAANACDEEVSLKEGGTEPRYRVGLIVSDDRPHSEALETIRDAMAGHSLERAGQFGPIAGVAQTVISDLALTDDDMLAGQKTTFSRYRSRSEIATAIFGKFSDPEQKWESVDFPGRVSLTDDAAMGERLAQHIDLTQIHSGSQAQRVAEVIRRRSMMQAYGSCTVGARWIAVQPGDWIPYNSDRYGDMTVEIQSATINPEHTVTLAWRQIAGSVFAWTTAAELDPLAPGVSPDPGQIITEVPDFAAATAQLTGTGGLVQPAIKATWTPITAPAVDRLIIQHRKVGETDAVETVAPVPSAGMAMISNGIQAGTAYEVRAKLETTPVRDTPWTDWEEVTAGADHVVPQSLTVAPGGVDWQAITAELRELLEQVPPAISIMKATRDEMFAMRGIAGISGLQALLETVRNKAAQEGSFARVTEQITERFDDQGNALAEQITTVEAGAANAVAGAKDVLRAEIVADREASVERDALLGAAVGDNAAAIQSTQEALATETETRATQYTTLSGATGANSAAITSLGEALSDETAARTLAITSLTTTVSGNTADISTLGQSLSDETTARTLAITSLSGTVSGLSSTVTTVAEAVSDIDGKLTASYIIEVDANGNIAGMRAYSDGSSSIFAIRADKFRIALNDEDEDPVAVFAVEMIEGVPRTVIRGYLDADSIGARELKVGSVGIDQLIAGSATKQEFGTHGPFDGRFTTGLIVGITFEVAKGAVRVIYETNILSSGDIAGPGLPGQITFHLYVDGVLHTTWQWNDRRNDTGNGFFLVDASGPVNLTKVVTGLSAGFHTFQIYTGGFAGPATSGSLSIIELRN